MKKLLQTNFPKNMAVISFYDPPSNHSNPPVDYSAKTERVFAIAIHDIGKIMGLEFAFRKAD